MAKYIFLLLALLANVSAYCTTNDHSLNITDLPYLDANSTFHPCMYAGTMNVSLSSEDNHNLFYWFFRHQDINAPLLLWINGGPGASSMFGLFLENGPLRIEVTGTETDDILLKAAENSWADTYNIIYLDQPVNTGFSYGDSSIKDLEKGG